MTKDKQFIKLYVERIRNGDFAKLDGASVKTLLVLASFIDKDGYCFPNQSTLAQLAGVDVRTVRRHIATLLEYMTPSGHHVLTVEKQKYASSEHYHNRYRVGAFSHYGRADKSDQPPDKYDLPTGQICPIPRSDMSYKEEPIEEEPIKKNQEEVQTTQSTIIEEKEVQEMEYNAQNVIVTFIEKYKEVYGVDYHMAKSDWARYKKLVKEKVIETYTDGELVFKTITTMFEMYEDPKFNLKKPDYPAPTLLNFANFLFQRAYMITQEKSKTNATDTERIDREQVKAKEQLEALGGENASDEAIAEMFARFKNRNKPQTVTTLTKEDEESRGF